MALLVRGRPGALLLAIALVTYPVLHALGPVAGVTSEGRYFFCFIPLLAAGAGPGGPDPVGHRPALSRPGRSRPCTGLWNIPPGNSGVVFGRLVPKSLDPLISSLRAERVDAVFADYWIAYRLTFESRERVIGSALEGERYPPYGRDRPPEPLLRLGLPSRRRWPSSSSAITSSGRASPTGRGGRAGSPSTSRPLPSTPSRSRTVGRGG